MSQKTSITFKPPEKLERKLERYMKQAGIGSKTEAINQALELGIDTLEAIGWDMSRELAGRLINDMQPPAPPKAKSSISQSA